MKLKCIGDLSSFQSYKTLIYKNHIGFNKKLMSKQLQGDFLNICGLLRKPELYNKIYYLMVLNNHFAQTKIAQLTFSYHLK